MDVWENSVTADVDKLTLTLKGGKDYNAPWIVIHAASTEEAKTLLKETEQELLELVASASQAFQKAVSGGAYTPPPRQAQKPSAPPQQTNGYKPCPEHGPLVYHEPFQSRAGKDISGRMACGDDGCRNGPVYFQQKDGSFKEWVRR